MDADSQTAGFHKVLDARHDYFRVSVVATPAADAAALAEVLKKSVPMALHAFRGRHNFKLTLV